MSDTVYCSEVLPAQSSGSPKRPSGIIDLAMSLLSFSHNCKRRVHLTDWKKRNECARTALLKSVLMMPGAMQLTRTP